MRPTHNNKVEYKLFLTACLIGIIVSLILFIFDALVVREIIPSVIEASNMFIFLFFFYQVKFKNRLQQMLTPFLVVVLIIFNVIWFTHGGLNLANSLKFLLILLLVIMISTPKSRPVFLTLICFNLIIFTASEFIFRDNNSQIKDIEFLIESSVTLFISFGVCSYFLLYFKKHYDLERELVNKQNFELDASNSEIEAQNEELVQYQEEVMAQRDFIEEKNKILELQAIELERVNDENRAINATLEKTVTERTKKLMDLNNDLDLLVYRSSHDFRRPLTTLMGLYEIARLTVKDDLSRELFNKVNSTAQNMDKMLLKFFMLYNINHFRTMTESNTLSDIIEKIDRRLISRKKDISFNHKLELYTYYEKDARNSLIEIILENLVENSLIYNHKAHIEIDLKIIEKDGMIRISLQDNGNGIPASFRGKVFDMYFRGSTLSQGNGLGLYVTKRAVDLLNATMTLDSMEDEFTSFSIVFNI